MIRNNQDEKLGSCSFLMGEIKFFVEEKIYRINLRYPQLRLNQNSLFMFTLKQIILHFHQHKHIVQAMIVIRLILNIINHVVKK